MTQRIYDHEAVHPKYGCIAAIKSCLLILCELLLQSPWLHAIQTKVTPKLDEFFASNNSFGDSCLYLFLLGGLLMKGMGAKLRVIRQKWGLTLREVEERSARLAKDWGNPSYRISASWLDRVEREDRRLAAAKLIVLAVVYSIPADQLLSLCSQESGNPPHYDHLSGPNTTLLLTGGPLERQARLWLPDNVANGPIPDATTLSRRKSTFRVITAEA